MKTEKTNEYAAMFRMKLIEGLQYRAAAIAGVSTQFFFGLLFLMIYHAFYRFSPDQSMAFADLASYNWLRQAFLAIAAMWSQDNDLLESIANGNVTYEFCRPYRMFDFWFARLLATRIARVLLRCLPILAIAFFLPALWSMNPPGSAICLALFLVSIALSAALAVAISMFIYILTFTTLSSQGPRMLVSTLTDLFSGTIVPLPLIPAPLQTVLYCMPFAYMADLPYRIYSGNIPPAQAVLGISVQAAWIIALYFLGRWSFDKVSARVVIQGG
ncbi:ABC transporter permease [Clostridia bacterium]|nr:ABC transporter permease [Clostridia bacterium]